MVVPRIIAPLAFAVVLMAGCLAPASMRPEAMVAPAPSPSTFPVTCLIVDERGTALSAGTCTFAFGGDVVAVAVDGVGHAVRDVRAGLAGTLTGSAPGRNSQSTRLVIDRPVSVRFALVETPSGPGGGPSSSLPPSPGAPTAQPPVVPTPPVRRHWLPATVMHTNTGSEPAVAVTPDGAIFVTDDSGPLRSLDGGRSFSVLDPVGLPSAVESNHLSDSAVSLAPDGSVWWTSGYLGSTTACRSVDDGDTWTCDVLAIPGQEDDRMWVVGLSAQDGIVQTGQALEHPEYARTATGSASYVPMAVSVVGQFGNMVYDDVHEKVFQIGRGSLAQVADGMVLFQAIDVPQVYAIPWIVATNGTLWTTGEADGKVLVARSLDEGRTWSKWPVSMEPKEGTFSYVAARPDGRAAVVYYGSDTAGPSTSNGGHWSLYVAETDNGLDDQPTWVETRLVDQIHTGNLCIGLNCEQTGGDPSARMAGDMIGSTLDADGNMYVTYVRQNGTTFTDEFMRQVRD